MKIIFLDIDGVLNSQQFYKKRFKIYPSKDKLSYKMEDLDPIAIKYLNKKAQ